MLRVVGRQIDSTKQNVAFLVLNEDSLNTPPIWMESLKVKELLKKYNFANLNKKLQCTDGKENSFSTIPIYKDACTISSKKKAILLWGYKDTKQVQGYGIYLPTGFHTIKVDQMNSLVTQYGLANASYNQDTGVVRLQKGHLRYLWFGKPVATPPNEPTKVPEKEVLPEQTGSLVGGTPSKVAEIVTKKVLEQLQNGIVPWQKPWVGNNGVYSYETQKPYQGVNVFLLSEPGEYITYNMFKKLKEKNPNVAMKDHVQWEIVVYWHIPKAKKEDTKKSDSSVEDEDEETKTKKVVPKLMYYKVAHIKYFEGIPSKRPPIEQQTEVKPVELAEKTIVAYTTKYGIQLEQVEGGDQAYYQPGRDYICVPAPKQFKSMEEYYQTCMHECSHSTGKYLNRLEHAVFGDKAYSKEELIAEISANIILAELGIEPAIENSASYIAGWARALQQNQNILPIAAQQAQKAAELILACKPVLVEK